MFWIQKVFFSTLVSEKEQKRAAWTFVRDSPFVFHRGKFMRIWNNLRVMTESLGALYLFLTWMKKPLVYFARKPRLWIVAPCSSSASSLLNPSGSLSASSAGYCVCSANSISVLSLNRLEIICDLKAVNPPEALTLSSRDFMYCGTCHPGCQISYPFTLEHLEWNVWPALLTHKGIEMKGGRNVSFILCCFYLWAQGCHQSLLAS